MLTLFYIVMAAIVLWAVIKIVKTIFGGGWIKGILIFGILSAVIIAAIPMAIALSAVAYSPT